MHPAYSVIVFTSASGAGYGLLIWLALGALLGLLPAGTGFAVAAFGIAVGLVVVGLLSSTLHLGRPERAWRAFSQWRTSWLSREGVAAVATFVPVAVFGLAWLASGRASGLVVVGALGTILGALATLWCTGQIYASLKTVPAWNRPLVSPLYVVLAIATGGVLFVLVTAAWGHGVRLAGIGTVVALAAAWLMKALYWSQIDGRTPQWTAEAATGLGRFGTVRQFEPPHTGENYLMREMGYQVARAHAERLRALVVVALAIVPAVAVTLALISSGGVAFLLALVATLSAAVGVLTERWLFFAEARHVVNVYYEGGAV